MGVAEFNLYEFNQANMAQIKPLDTVALKRLCIRAAEQIRQSDYWMLLNKERADYTLFHRTIGASDLELGEAIFETLTNRGKVIDFTECESGAYEIWIRIPYVNEKYEEGVTDFVFYLFNYNIGIVEV